MLEQINHPNDIQKIPEEALPKLAKEIRRFMIQKVSRTGGHLASNLGVVELTIALHRVYEFPKDKLIWDVGHQCYTHKILTGRKDQFDMLRKRGGISGFPAEAKVTATALTPDTALLQFLPDWVMLWPEICAVTTTVLFP